MQQNNSTRSPILTLRNNMWLLKRFLLRDRLHLETLRNKLQTTILEKFAEMRIDSSALFVADVQVLENCFWRVFIRRMDVWRVVVALLRCCNIANNLLPTQTLQFYNLFQLFWRLYYFILVSIAPSCIKHLYNLLFIVVYICYIIIIHADWRWIRCSPDRRSVCYSI